MPTIGVPVPALPVSIRAATSAAPVRGGAASRLLAAADAAANRVVGQRFNPLYQSGTIVIALYLVLLVTGIWLLLFYRVGSPWESVAAITGRPYVGRWVRGVHRYASDLAVVATLVHALRMFAQGRSRGPRATAWVSGWVLLLLILVCGWTGFVMVWDSFGAYLAAAGARMLDVLPMLSEPTSRAFTGEQPVPSAFFFLNLFAHIGIPLGMGVVFWLHVRRLARPLMMPPRPVTLTIVGVLVATAVIWPVTMAPRADLLARPATVPADLFFAFWIPVARHLSGGASLLVAIGCGVALLVLPWAAAAARGRTARPPASEVDEDVCVGCVQCSLDCPYGAITMVPRDSKRSPLVARVDPDLCVSCGICSGSCAPMGIGPPGRSGRDQLARVQGLVAAQAGLPGRVVAIACTHGAHTYAAALAAAGAVPYEVDCAGHLHSSVVEVLLRAGAGGVLVLSCPPRDCWNREGPRWLDERLYHGREAELQARVDRARVRVVAVNAFERAEAVAALHAFQDDVARLETPAPGRVTDVGSECEPAPVGRRR